MGRYAILVDLDKCIGCRACQVACKLWNNRKPEKTYFSNDFTNPPDLSPQTWMLIKYKEVPEGGELKWLFTKWQCMHCTNAPCAQICPAGAIEVYPEGAVVIRSDKCVGCRYCIEACPYDIPRYDPETNKVYKCTFCIDRVQNGLEPACVRACPTGTLVFGERDELIARAKKEKKYVYGDRVNDYVGGTGYIYASNLPITDPKYYAFPLNPLKPTKTLRDVVRPAGFGITAAVLAIMAAYVVYWRAKRMGGGGEG